MKYYKNLKEVENGAKELGGAWTGTDKLMARSFPLLIKKLEAIEEAIKKTTRRKREPSQYNLHIASEVKSGKTFAEAVESWKEANKNE